jgi:DNA polymerase-3 subunit alpha
MTVPFVHLHLHSEYSITESIVQIKPLCQALKSQSATAIAITDINNLFAMVKFYKNAMTSGIKPIIGAECWVEHPEKNDRFHKLVLLCQNMVGYHNLTQLISRAYQMGERLSAPLMKKEWIKECSQGLIALSGAQSGEIGQAILQDSYASPEVLLQEWMAAFPDRFYLEIQRNNRQGEKNYEKAALDLAKQYHCPLVATNDVVFIHKDDFYAHKARVCIQEGVTLENSVLSANYSEEQYLKTPEQMVELFEDLPSAIANTLEIAKRCSLVLTLDQPVLPSFPVPAQMSEESYLEKASFDGLKQRLIEIGKETLRTQYEERLKIELRVINSMGFPGYFLIVADFIQWAKSQKIPVGPGRGSGAGSLVAYALSITDLDPIEYELLFERFLNPERVSMPDFDIDFCMDNRDRVIDYVAARYGRNNVSQIATFGTMAAKAVLRDVGRVLGHPYGFVDRLAKLVPFEIGMTLDKALVQEPSLKKLYDEEEEVKNLIDLAQKLEGITRSVGKHAGGVVIAPSKLTDYAPLYCEKDSDHIVIQLDKDDVETIGLTKFDFLGLRTLTIIDWAVKNANHVLAQKNEPLIDIQKIVLDDKKTFSLLKSCATTAVFQLESRGMKELIKRLQPDGFEEIIALVALFRPGPLQSGMVDDFINRKHGRAKVEYLHQAIEPILKPTYGVILYQEQVMQIAQTLAGYTLGGADLLRRAMGKKKPEEMAQQRTIFIEGAVSREVNEKTANTIFDLMEKFAGYGFNKSHSAAYALVSYQTAWLKAHFPSAFMAAVLSSDMDHTDKVVNFIEECRHCKLTVIPPNIQKSEYFFTVNDQNEIVYGLGAIKGVGFGAIEHIVEQRKSGPFRNIFDFCSRIDGRKVNKRVLSALIKSGSFDCFGKHRALLYALIDEAMKRAEQQAKNNSHGQADLFSHIQDENEEVSLEVIPWTTEEQLQGEKESLGMFFSGHPLEAVEAELTQMGVQKFSQVQRAKKDQKFTISGLLVALKTLQTKNGDRMAVLTVDDRFDRFEVTLFPEPYQTYRELLVKDQLIFIHGTCAMDNFSGGSKIRANAIYSLSGARELFAKKVTVQLNNDQVSADFIQRLKECLAIQERGNCPVYVQYQRADSQVVLKLDPQWNIVPSTKTLEQMKLFLDQAVLLDY